MSTCCFHSPRSQVLPSQKTLPQASPDFPKDSRTPPIPQTGLHVSCIKDCIRPTSRAPWRVGNGNSIRSVWMNCKLFHTMSPVLQLPSLKIPFGRNPSFTGIYAQHWTLNQTQVPPHLLNMWSHTPPPRYGWGRCQAIQALRHRAQMMYTSHHQ